MHYFDLIEKYKASANLDNKALASEMNAIAGTKSIAFRKEFQSIDSLAIEQVLDGDEDFEFLPEDHALFVQIFSEQPEFAPEEFETAWQDYVKGK